jgi:hypothetical protein
MEVVVKLIYEKSIFSPRFAYLYADLCSVLAKELNKVEMEDGSIVDFKTCILDHCKSNLQTCFTKEPIDTEISDEERAEKEFKRKDRMKSNITFIGELYLRQLLRPVIVHLVIRSLLDEDEKGALGKPEPEQLELCIKLMTTIQGFKGYPKEQAMTGRYFHHLAKLIEDTHYEIRIRFAIEELLKQKDKNFSTVPKAVPPKKTDAKFSQRTEPNIFPRIESRKPQSSDARTHQRSDKRSPHTTTTDFRNPPPSSEKRNHTIRDTKSPHTTLDAKPFQRRKEDKSHRGKG